MEYDTVLIDEKEYFLLRKKKLNDNIYCFLVNINDENDVIIRKIIVEDSIEYMVGLNDEKELFDVLVLFNVKGD